MHHVDIATLQRPGRAAVADHDNSAILARLITAVVPALGILAACAVMLSTIA